MIISHKHKFIFIKTKKTAGTSIEIALSAICGEDDIISPIAPADEKARKNMGVRSAQNYTINPTKWDTDDLMKILSQVDVPTYYNHMPASEIRKYVPDEIWDSYYKFCFERNPFDKVLSLFHWINKVTDNDYDTLDDFIEDGHLDRIHGFDLYTIGNVVAVDDIYKFEELEESMDRISQKLHLDTPLRLPSYKAKSNTRKDRRHYSEVLTPKQREIIKLAFARELELMDYVFEMEEVEK